MSKYVKLPVILDAVQWRGCWRDVVRTFGFWPSVIKNYDPSGEGGVTIDLRGGQAVCRHLDYMIRGVNGEYYPCEREIFEKTYRPVDMSACAVEQQAYHDVTDPELREQWGKVTPELREVADD